MTNNEQGNVIQTASTVIEGQSICTINTLKQFNHLSRNANKLTGSYCLILNRAILDRISAIFNSGENAYKNEKKLLAMVTEVKISKETNIFNEHLPTIVKIRKSNQPLKLNLRSCKYITDVSALKDVDTLDLSWTNITDVSELGNIDTLDLSHTKVADVSALKNVRVLDLSSTNVTDVSALGKVHTLKLNNNNHTVGFWNKEVKENHKEKSKLGNITDVSALGGVHALELSNTNVNDVSMLGDVDTLDLSNTKVTDVSKLENVRKLNLSNTSVRDVSKLGNVDTLDLSYTQVADVSSLGKVRKLNLSNTEISDVSKLIGVQELDISYTYVTDVSTLKKVKKLNIDNTDIIINDKNLKILSGIPELIANEKIKQAINNFRKYFYQPSKASAISVFSELGFHLLWAGKLANVKPLKATQYQTATEEKKTILLKEIKQAINKTLENYNELWRSPEEMETTRSSYIALKNLKQEGSLEDIINAITHFFNTSPGNWCAGKKVVSGGNYKKGQAPSIKPLLMKYLLTMKSFQVKNINEDTLYLTTSELTHGLEYKLNLTKNYFGGCNITGLIRFFENECQRAISIPTPPIAESSLR